MWGCKPRGWGRKVWIHQMMFMVLSFAALTKPQQPHPTTHKPWGPQLPTATPAGFLRLLFLTDDTVSYSGFQLRYSLSASLNPRPSCGGGQAALTAVVDVYGYGSDISWALAQVWHGNGVGGGRC